jgi:hypothetical protein
MKLKKNVRDKVGDQVWLEARNQILRKVEIRVRGKVWIRVWWKFRDWVKNEILRSIEEGNFK